MKSTTMRMMGRRLVPDDFAAAAKIIGLFPISGASFQLIVQRPGKPVRALGLREADSRATRLS
jgi:hypothetical protein